MSTQQSSINLRRNKAINRGTRGQTDKAYAVALLRGLAPACLFGSCFYGGGGCYEGSIHRSGYV